MPVAAAVSNPEPVRESLTHRPSSALMPYVTSITGYTLDGIQVIHHGLPSTELTFIVAIGTPLRCGWSADRSRSGDFQALLSGLHTSPAFIFPIQQHAGIQLGLTPAGARALFGLPAAGLHAELVDLQQSWGSIGTRLGERLTGCRCWADRFAVLDAELEAMLVPDPAPIRRELRWAWHQLVHRGATQTVQLADEIGWSRGYFARLFAAEFGLKPKETARIVRFGAAKRALGQPGAVMADVAFDCGYADQAHLTREWKRLSGCTPTEWLVEMSAFVQDDRASTAQG